MALFNKKKEEIKIEELPEEIKDISKDEVEVLKGALLSRDEVKLYLTVEEGKRLYNLAMKIDK